MSSRFVSAGAIDAATGAKVEVPASAGPGKAAAAAPAVPVAQSSKDTEAVVPLSPTTTTTTTTTIPTTTTPSEPPASLSARSAEWAAVERELAEERRRKAERRAAGDAKSLYDMLQENKAAKQAAFDEAHALKNQFRALDADEVEFLQSVDSTARAEAARLRAETATQLTAFRAAQGGGKGGDEKKEEEEEEVVVVAEKEVDNTETAWQPARKRRRKGERAVPGLVKRRDDRKGEAEAPVKAPVKAPKEASKETPLPTPAPKKAPPAKRSLVDYGSDSDSD